VIDRELVIRKMVLIAGDLDGMRRVADQSLDAYLGHPTDELVVERYFERVIGRMIDINYHLLVETGEPPPADYHESFVRLTALGVLSREFAAQIASCAGLRNRIAHEYDAIDPAKVYEALHTALRDIPLYLQRVRDYLDRGGG
jgi:uncharacterized protein YutE (UPF0331/DUF86 family)